MMKKFVKFSLLVSLAVNIVLIVGVVWFRNYNRTVHFELAAMNYEAMAMVQEHTLEVLESGNPLEIESLKVSLQKQIEQAKKGAEIWKKAANKS